MLDRLALVPGSAPEHGAFFWEPSVDGVPVRRLLHLGVRGLGPVAENVPVFVHSWPFPWVGDVLAL
ncbi:hypothetical protein, partial [Cellulomonas sp. GbtcB1]|uniref:hypothetical protein n=1 Tax=Cellulomonas sp. GbtcB1 TaxID=2824746 RepID=UPI001C3060DF